MPRCFQVGRGRAKHSWDKAGLRNLGSTRNQRLYQKSWSPSLFVTVLPQGQRHPYKALLLLQRAQKTPSAGLAPASAPSEHRHLQPCPDLSGRWNYGRFLAGRFSKSQSTVIHMDQQWASIPRSFTHKLSILFSTPASALFSSAQNTLFWSHRTLFKKLPISITNCHSNRAAFNPLQKRLSEGRGCPPRTVEIPLDCWKLTMRNSPGQHYLSIHLPKIVSFLPHPPGINFSKIINSCKKEPDGKGSIGFGVVLGFFQFTKSTTSQHALDAPYWGWRKSWIHIKESHHHQNTSVSSYLCPGFRLWLCAWLHCALLLQRRKGKQCHSMQKLLQLQAEAEV